MLNIFKKKQNNFKDITLNLNDIKKEKNCKIQSNCITKEYNNLIYSPSSSKE